MTSLAATDLDFTLDEAGVFQSLDRHVVRFRVPGEKFRGVALLMGVASGPKENSRAFVFQFGRRQDSLAHRLLAQAGVERIGILSFDKRSEALRHCRRAGLPFRKR